MSVIIFNVNSPFIDFHNSCHSRKLFIDLISVSFIRLYLGVFHNYSFIRYLKNYIFSFIHWDFFLLDEYHLWIKIESFLLLLLPAAVRFLDLGESLAGVGCLVPEHVLAVTCYFCIDLCIQNGIPFLDTPIILNNKWIILLMKLRINNSILSFIFFYFFLFLSMIWNSPVDAEQYVQSIEYVNVWYRKQ